MGSLALAMIGIICLAPVLANLLRPVVVPSIPLGPTLPCSRAPSWQTTWAARPGPELAPGGRGLRRTVVGAMLGPPSSSPSLALGIIQKRGPEFLAKGVLAGVITIPLGAPGRRTGGGVSGGYGAPQPHPYRAHRRAHCGGAMAHSYGGMVKFTVFGKIVVIVITVSAWPPPLWGP